MNIFPTAYLPSIQYISSFVKTESPVIESLESYQKQSCRTRTMVMTANGIQVLTVPIIKVHGNHTLTKDIEIAYKEPWQHVHLRCLESAYKKSAYFDYYFPYLEKAYRNRFKTLMELNDFCLNTILKLLKINKVFSYTSDYERIKDNDDYRISLSKNDTSSYTMPKYYQVFADRHGFVPNLSVIDLLFNEGPNAINFL